MNTINEKEKPALPRKWIVPIRLAVYVVLAACSGYVFYYARDLELTHLIIFLPVAAIAAMVLLDCKFSEKYWNEQEKEIENNK